MVERSLMEAGSWSLLQGIFGDNGIPSPDSPLSVLLPEPFIRDGVHQAIRMALRSVKPVQGIGDRGLYVIIHRFYHKQTLQNLADQMNVTRERIRQIEQKTLRELCHPRIKRRLQPYIDYPHRAYREFLARRELAILLGYKTEKGTLCAQYAQRAIDYVVALKKNQLRQAFKDAMAGRIDLSPTLLVHLQCPSCGNIFKRTKGYINSSSKYHRKNIYCSKECIGRSAGRQFGFQPGHKSGNNKGRRRWPKFLSRWPVELTVA